MATIRDAEITGDFVHEPLEHPQDEIRLIQVDLSDKDSEIICTTLTCPIKRPVPYLAISYTWGDISQKRVIQVNGKQVIVGYNSWLALWQARLHLIANRSPATPLWIDILSIDQSNDDEKSIQVGLMGAIYRSAIYVIASVGPHEDDSELLADQIHANARYIEQQRHLRGEIEDKPLESLPCAICGRIPERSIYRCKQNCESIRFCSECERYADRHEVYEDGVPVRIEDHIHKTCVDCERELTRRYYTYTNKNTDEQRLTFCRSCAQPRIEQAQAEGVLTHNFVLTDDWGDVDQPAIDTSHTAHEQWQTSVRAFELPQKLHQQTIDALRAFSLRPYFTRLWVRIPPELQAADHRSKFSLTMIPS